MDDANNENLLWHTTAQKLIKYAGKFKYTSNEFERQVGYLLLDVGVETLFRSFLTMPDSKAKLTFKKREEAAKGTVEKNDFIGEKLTLASFDEISFHKLVEAVRQVSESGFNENDLKRVEHYHNIRNKIYHLGEGIIPAKQKLDGYLQLAEKLLKILLTTKKQSEDDLTDDEAFWRDIEIKLLSHPFGIAKMQTDFQKFQLNIGAAAELFAPRITGKRFEKAMKQLEQKYGDNEDASVSERYGKQLIRIQVFQKLTGTDFDDVDCVEGDFVDDVLNDITHLYLVILLDNKVVDDEDVDNYLEYRDLIEMFYRSPDETPKVLKEKILQFQDWAKKIEEKLDTLPQKKNLIVNKKRIK